MIIKDGYFEWMVDLVCGDRYSDGISFNKLLSYLHEVDFRYSIPRDRSRMEDGIDLRYRYAYETGNEVYTEWPCSVLEMMIALSIRCEERIMSDPDYGDRTGQWFWGMVVNLGLGGMSDNAFDEAYVDYVVERFLDREYEADGRGGLFTVENRECDMRDVEIFYQLNWYLDTLV